MEIAVLYSFCIALIVAEVINICHECCNFFATYRKCICVKYFDLSAFEFSFNFIKFSLCARSGSLFAYCRKGNGTCGKCACVVNGDFAVVVFNGFDYKFKVRLPVDSGRYDKCIGASCFCGAVV